MLLIMVEESHGSGGRFDLSGARAEEDIWQEDLPPFQEGDGRTRRPEAIRRP